MIIWVNGAFGSGKTTLVAEVRGRLPEALVFDPEEVGFLLRRVVPDPAGDFRDLPLWRRQVVSLAAGLATEYGRPVLVPMTLVRPKYLAEVFDGLAEAGVPVRHFFLRVPDAVLAARIDARSLTPDDPARDEQVRAWCRSRIAECRAAEAAMPLETAFLDGELTPAQLADLLLADLAL
ncbi:AAA family ATPase [Kitasatospora sp. NPDC059646]|uniref:AAA family ATPase n=1 Tax=Kitasatospora sp. NPDC059646 TaxID=3346893 RepID=UPI0036BF21FA